MNIVLYNLFLFLYKTIIHIVALWNPKAALWTKGRRNQFAKMGNDLKGNSQKSIWMHCASLGEFEQGRPLLEEIRKVYPSYPIILTFFSPSGYEIRKKYNGADQVYYLPMDGRMNAKKFIQKINPTLVIWVKYDYWYYFLREIHQQQIPLLLVAANFRESQPFFKWYGGLWKKMLTFFTKLFVQSKDSVDLLYAIGIKNVEVSGDPRFDRVITIAETETDLPDFVETFTKNMQVIVCGSTWPEDEFQWLHFVKTHPDVKFIFAPHEVDIASIHEVQQKFPGAVLYSEAEKKPEVLEGKQILIVDNIGKLSALYTYATITYIGGGFNESGIHNTLEAAVYGKPVIFGPQYKKFSEANGLIAAGAAYTISTPVELEKIVKFLLKNKAELMRAGKAAHKFVYENKGATASLLSYIQANRLLTS